MNTPIGQGAPTQPNADFEKKQESMQNLGNLIDSGLAFWTTAALTAANEKPTVGETLSKSAGEETTKSISSKVNNPKIDEPASEAVENCLVGLISGPTLEQIQSKTAAGLAVLSAINSLNQSVSAKLEKLGFSSEQLSDPVIAKSLLLSPQGADKIYNNKGQILQDLITALKDPNVTPEMLAPLLVKAAKGLLEASGLPVNKFLVTCAVVALALAMMQLIKDQEYRKKLDSAMWIANQQASKEIAHDIAGLIKDKGQLEFLQGVFSAVLTGLGSAVSIGGISYGMSKGGELAAMYGQIGQASGQLFNGMMTHLVDAGFAPMKANIDAMKTVSEYVEKFMDEMRSKISSDSQSADDFINQLVQTAKDLQRQLNVINSLTPQGGG